MLSVFLGVHAVLSVVLIGLILIQRGKGADIGAAFGSGASQTVFGSQGAASFLTRTTAILATLFFVSSLWLAHLYGQRVEHKSVTETTAPMTAPLESLTTGDTAEQSTPADVPSLPVRDTTDTAGDIPGVPVQGGGEVPSHE